MFYLEHCRTAISEQIQVLMHYQSEIEELDFDFIRNHALSIYQFSDHIVNIQGGSGGAHDLGTSLNTGELLTKDQCRRALAEQIQLLGQYLQENEEPDFSFVRVHALYIMELSDHLRRAKSGPSESASGVDRITRCHPIL